MNMTVHHPSDTQGGNRLIWMKVHGQVAAPPRLLPVARDAPRKCLNCDRVGHLAKDCRQMKRDSSGRANDQAAWGRSVVTGGRFGPPVLSAKMVRGDTTEFPGMFSENPLEYFLSDSDGVIYKTLLAISSLQVYYL